MEKIRPYEIYHFQLGKEAYKNASLLPIGGHFYCVFWWFSIALGDLYIDAFDGNELALRTNIFIAIMPNIKKYIANNEPITNIEQAFIKGDDNIFYSLMKNEIARYLPTQLPEKVGISVVICTRQRSGDLKLCLESLKKQTCTPAEIIVIDNAPLDESTKQVVEQFDAIIYCKETRPGLDIARNTGARLASFPIVAYTDDDVELHPLWSYRVWETFASNDIDAMTGLIIALELETESQQIFEKHWGFNKGYLKKEFNKSFFTGNNKKLSVWEIGAGANMAFKKSLLEKVGFFDERLDVGAAGCNGDSEIWYRILAHGNSIHYNPMAAVFHKHRKELAGLHKQLFSYMRGHAAAALVQHAQNIEMGYKKYLYKDIPLYYFFLLRTGFPNYPFRYRTLWTEIKGLISGIRFYNKNKNTPALTENR